MTSLSFSIENLWFLCFFSLMPMFFAIEKYISKLKKRQALISFFLFGFSLYSTLMLWLLELSPVLEEQMSKTASYALILLAVFLSSLFLGIFYDFGLVIICRLSKNKNTDAIIFGFLYILGEYLTQTFTPLSFPWARLSAIVTPFTAFIQSANLFGGLFVSLIIALINAFLCRALIEIKAPKKAAMPLMMAIVIFASNSIYGIVRLVEKESQQIESASNAVLVQGNFSGLSKWRKTREEIITTYIQLAESKIDENTSLVVFPETAAPFRLYTDENSLNMLVDFAKRNNITLVTGVFFEEQRDDMPANVYNALICIEPDGTISEPYFKQILVPIGEYVPFSDMLIERFPELFEIIGYVKPGEVSGAVKTSSITVGGVICYESIYPNIVRKTVNDGAEVIALISNDSWFGESAALRQHHAHAILRAVENERYVLRASSTAITSVIDSCGNVIEVAPTLETASIKVDYDKNTKKTLYGLLGDVILIPSAAIYLYAIIGFLKHKTLLKKPSKPAK